jgi:Tfp pilus assembly protein PilX
MIETRINVLRRRAADEGGFTMVVAMMTLMIVTLLIAAAFVAANGDVNNSRHDLDGKRAYYSARAGLSRFLFELNKNNELWQTCPTSANYPTPQPVSGSSGQTYLYSTLPANGAGACSATNPVGTLIDLPTGSFRMKFTGTSGTVSRTIVAQFKRDSPLDYLYYSKYETLDPNTYAIPSNYSVCAAFIRDGRPSMCGQIQWVTGDQINGPLYTQDQYVLCGSPTFGRAGGTDTMKSAAPNPPGATITNCAGNPTYNTPNGTGGYGPIANAGTLDPPSDNTNLLPYAQANGKVYTGKTTITITGSTATVVNQPTATSTPATTSVNLATYPLIYVTNGSGCAGTYTPYFNGTSTYTNGTSCGNVQISTAPGSNYTSSFTVAAANDIIIGGNLTTSLSGSAVAGLVANNFIRVMHGVNRTSTAPQQCGTNSNITANTLPDVEIDAAILALQHSFIVDNYDCGSPIAGHLNVTGAIAQIFRGTVGTGGGGTSVNSGYLKNYNYDDRLAILQPPYLFDLAQSAWRVIRETGCTPGSADATLAC